MNTNRQTNKFVRFLQNNTALLIIILCVLAIVAVIMIVAFTGNNDIDQAVSGQTDDTTDTDDNDVADDDIDSGEVDTDDTLSDNTDTEPTLVQVYFVSPVAEYTVGMGYTDGAEVLFVFNATLNSWTTHNSVSLIADEGTEVTSMHDGTVVEVSESYAMGGSVTIDYGNDIIATFSSLSNIVVVEGQVVAQGETIATVSTTANNEFMEGDHVTVAITVEGVTVDPTPYIEGAMYIEVESE